MRRLTLFALTATLAAATPAAWANKNRTPQTLTCDGEPLTLLGSSEKADENSASPILGGGSFKPVEVRFFVHGTGEEVFSFANSYPRPPTTTCTGTIKEGEELFDVIATGALNGR